jgi:hypothetical protein
MARFIPKITTLWSKVDSVKYPHASGLTDTTAAELKKY